MKSHNPEKPFVTVVIPVLNNALGIIKCLNALDLQSYPKDAYEVLVIDNGSKDNIQEVTKGYSQTRLLFEDYPSQAAARNKGIINAKGDIIAFTDSDCIPALDWLEKGVDQLLRIPDCKYLGGKITVFFQKPEKPTACELYEYIYAFPQKKYIEEQRFSTTANLFTRKSLFNDVGLFKKSSYTGSDNEWGNEVYSKGYQQVYADDVQILHPARHNWRQLSLKQARIRLSRYRKAIQKKPLSSIRTRLRWIIKTPHLRKFYSQTLDILANQNLVGIMQRVSVIYILLRRLYFDFVIRFSVVYGIDLKHDYKLLRENTDQNK
ncbi:MAG: glycosyltransferase [Lentisphaeria bacterium]|nr:glycosyltransferase [Lentisphaeria bacterium]NQZ66884.1 glycosyltransferase [Lentisphaeria bacterium]